MPLKNKTSEKDSYNSAIALEKEKKYTDAVKIYESIIAVNPLHLDSQNRLMVLYRKLKETKKEVQTITRAIKSYQGKIEADQKDWIRNNRKKADVSRELASSLGLLNSKGLPIYENEILSKWKSRLSLLQQRIDKAKTKAQPLRKKK